MERIKALQQKLKELYERGLSRKQRVAIVLVIFLALFIPAVIIYSFLGSQNNGSPEKAGIRIPNTKSSINQPERSNNPSFQDPDLLNSASNANSQESRDEKSSPKYLPEIPNNPYEQKKAQPPGPMDGTFTKIRDEYKNNPDFVLIDGFLYYLKQVADGKRAWNDYYRIKAAEYLGDAKARELENEIKRINGDKELKIENTSYYDLNELTSAIKKETEVYVEKSAINQYLEHVQEIADDHYPWNEEAIGLGEVNLENTWIDQITAKIGAIKEKKAENFRSRSYKTVEELMAAIKVDTKNYQETVARDAFLDYVLGLAQKNALTQAAIWSGGYLLEQYHLEELAKFVNK